MYIINKEKNLSGGYPALQSWDENSVAPETHYLFPDKFFNQFYREDKRVAGFVDIIVDEKSNTVVGVNWNDKAYDAFVATLPDETIGAKEDKIAEMSKSCEEAIYAGTDIEVSTGKKHFSYGLVDQNNISEMLVAIMGGATEYPYHADGEECQLYSAQDIVVIYSVLSMYKTGHITYNNQLKQYINSLKTVVEVNDVQYGTPLKGEYLNRYNELMEQAKMQISSVVNKMAL